MKTLGQMAAVVIIFILLLNGIFSLLGDAQLRASMDEETYEVYRTAVDISGIWSVVTGLLAIVCIIGFVVVILGMLGVFNR